MTAADDWERQLRESLHAHAREIDAVPPWEPVRGVGRRSRGVRWLPPMLAAATVVVLSAVLMSTHGSADPNPHVPNPATSTGSIPDPSAPTGLPIGNPSGIRPPTSTATTTGRPQRRISPPPSTPSARVTSPGQGGATTRTQSRPQRQGTEPSSPLRAPSTTPAGPTTSSTRTSDNSAPPQRCTSGNLTLTPGLVQGAAGSGYAAYEIGNVGTKWCTLAGYPTVVVRDDAGDQVGAPAAEGRWRDTPDQVLIDGGGSAEIQIRVSSFACDDQPPATRFGSEEDITLPGTDTAFVEHGSFSTCRLAVSRPYFP